MTPVAAKPKTPDWQKWAFGVTVGLLGWFAPEAYRLFSGAQAEATARIEARAGENARAVATLQTESRVLAEREAAHYSEIQRQLAALDKKLDEVLAEVKR